MLRRFGGGRLSASQKTQEDVNPMLGMSNLVDAMLILAVGIMLALIMHWNVDVATVQDVEELNNAENLNDNQVEKIENNQGLQEKGVVYQDPETGKYYVKVEGNKK